MMIGARTAAWAKAGYTAITNGTVKVETYEDGFKMPFPMSPRHLEYRAKLEAARKRKPKTITVEHNAATGKDEVQQ